MAARTDAQHHCSTCSLHDLCLPMGMTLPDMNRLDKIIGRRRRVARGSYLYRSEDPFQSLYAVHFGHFKTRQFSAEGDEQVTGFQMAGELLGWDAISTDRHHCEAIALEDSEVCEIPFHSLEGLFGEMPQLLHHFHRLMSREITGKQNVMLLLGNMQAEQKMAAFLVNLSARYAARGYSSTQFQLRMSREDMGNFLGLTIESISRLLSKFKKLALLHVDGRELQILDMPALKNLAAGVAN
ncbi:MAG: fumarate/nitrate reduction transcriptional regulator Fnr [Burkholderiaceae bacterium]|nr:fumarate/nitrate reduction transcriptional regulator Fnr [Burkholderiaceae bacterium]